MGAKEKLARPLDFIAQRSNTCTMFEWLLGPRPPETEPELTPSMRQRLDELEERCRLQEKGLKALELDWQEWFDKFRLLYARLSKRLKDAANAEGNGSESRQDAPESTIPIYRGPATSRRNY